MITLTKVEKKYFNKIALADVNLTLTKGKIIGLVGENGSGKSTTLKLIAGLAYPTKGHIEVLGQKVTRQIASSVSYLSELDTYYSFYTIEQTIAFYASQFQDFNTEKAFQMCEFLNIDKSKKWKHLSKGNRGRVKIVLSLAREVPIILMDEPLSGLDPLVRDSIVKSLLTFVDLEKQLVIITSHEILELESILDEVIAIKNGAIIGHEQVEDLREIQQKNIVEWMKDLYNS
ncbi:ABC transporter ATP-binding protein [Bacillus sp. TS-2]|nr:ABC transporter ATP-binding protein [Bacillus sp. TS-2]